MELVEKPDKIFLMIYRLEANIFKIFTNGSPALKNSVKKINFVFLILRFHRPTPKSHFNKTISWHFFGSKWQRAIVVPLNILHSFRVKVINESEYIFYDLTQQPWKFFGFLTPPSISCLYTSNYMFNVHFVTWKL